MPSDQANNIMTDTTDTDQTDTTEPVVIGCSDLLDFDSCYDVMKQHTEDCYKLYDDDPCPNCGCDISDVFYLFGYYRCDYCVDLSIY